MEHIRENGIYGEDDVWRFYTVEEAEQHQTQCSNWPQLLQELKQYLGKTWEDRRDVQYKLNNESIYHKYTIIGLEDNNAWADYYWIVEDAQGKRKYELANDPDFYKGIISENQ